MRLTHKTVLNFASENEAVAASEILGELPAFEEAPVVALENADGKRWSVEIYDDGALCDVAKGALADAGIAPAATAVEAIPDADWVSETQRALPPVHAGRFIVHGSHDRARVASQWAIEIDAGRAFGTAHHGTTKGCLLALERLSPIGADRVLDLGTGSGVLAIGAAKALGHGPHIVAVDVDPIAVEVARENVRLNGAGADIALFTGDGYMPRDAYALAPFDVIVANILAKPLLKLAPRIRELTRIGGTVILSGLLSGQAREIVARYRATGFVLVRRRDLEGWATLTLRRVG